MIEQAEQHDLEYDPIYHGLRLLVRAAYQSQKTRIMAGNRIYAEWARRHGVEPGKKQDELDTKAKEVLAKIKARYKQITKGLVAEEVVPDTFEPDDWIGSLIEFRLVDSWLTLQASEDKLFKAVGYEVQDIPVYRSWLKDVKGIGPILAGFICAEFDIKKARYVSSLWMYAGLDVAEDGRGRGRYPEHLVERRYTAKDGTIKTKMSVTYKPALKSKLLGVLAMSFLPKALNSPYAKIYYDSKRCLENHEKWGVHRDRIKAANRWDQASPGHRHNMARRRTIKAFLADLYREWRAADGLPVHPPYAEARLGRKHGEDIVEEPSEAFSISSELEEEVRREIA